MMTPTPTNDIVAETPVAQTAVKITGPTSGTGGLEATALESADLTVLQAVMSHGEPITAGRLVRTTGLPVTQLSAILESLNELRLLRRLNTLVPSYTAQRQ
jgi:hypothetical protein